MNLNKVITKIAGISECSDFSYACYITENLSNLLPNFLVTIIVKKLSDWKDWLENKCKDNKWCHHESPLIWRESGVYGGKSVYIGGISEFKKFINQYYGIDVELLEREKQSLNLDYILAQNMMLKNESEKFESNVLHITILGAGCSVCPDLVAQLATLKEFSEKAIIINLYDEPGHFFKLKDIVKDAKFIGGNLCLVQNLENLSDGLKFCNILIILDYVTREDDESTYQWLLRNYKNTQELAEQINLYAPSDIKVILCSMGPTCFCANVIVKVATKLNRNQVVAVSAHYGLEMMYTIAKSLNIDIKEMGCAPVWGFLGISQYVDILHILQKCSVYVPSKRALNKKTSTLSLGEKYSELRWLLYLTHNKCPYEELAKKKSFSMYLVGRADDFQKCKAICDLLKLWYQKDNIIVGDEIITLGIASDGSFNIPKDVYFSQPVYLKILDDHSRVWVPCSEFPFPSDCSAILINLMETAKSILKNMNIIDSTLI